MNPNQTQKVNLKAVSLEMLRDCLAESAARGGYQVLAPRTRVEEFTDVYDVSAKFTAGNLPCDEIIGNITLNPNVEPESVKAFLDTAFTRALEKPVQAAVQFMLD